MTMRSSSAVGIPAFLVAAVLCVALPRVAHSEPPTIAKHFLADDSSNAASATRRALRRSTHKAPPLLVSVDADSRRVAPRAEDVAHEFVGLGAPIDRSKAAASTAEAFPYPGLDGVPPNGQGAVFYQNLSSQTAFDQPTTVHENGNMQQGPVTSWWLPALTNAVTRYQNSGGN